MLVRDVVENKSRQVVMLDLEATVGEALARMVQHNIGSLPIVDCDGRLAGIISERDVLRLIHNRGDRFSRLAIAEVMTKNPITCGMDDEVNEVMGKMSERNIAKVPVLEQGELVGIVSVGDVVKVLYDKVHTENQHLISYIHGGV